MSNIDTITQLAEQQCKARGSRLTKKRKQVLVGLIQSDKALSAYELATIYKAQYGVAIPAMSVYRILQFLEDEHLVHKLNLANKYVACAHIKAGDSHAASQFLICEQCNKVKEIQIADSVLAALQNTIKKTGFQLKSPQLEINCLCDECVA